MMNAVPELAALGNLLWFLLGVGVLVLMAAPVLVWRSVARTNRLLEELLAEQRRTSAMLGAMRYQLMQQGADREPQDDRQAVDPAFILHTPDTEEQ